MKDIVESWHVHVYFDESNTQKAVWLAHDIKQLDLSVNIGELHYEPLGPHTRPQFCVTVLNDTFGKLVRWLALNHNGLSVLIHPNTEHELADHTERAIWLGTPVPLDLNKL